MSEPYECDAVLLSLPRVFKSRLETIPAKVPYLRVPAETAQRWKQRLAKMDGVKIGVVWAGNPEHANDHRRSIELNRSRRCLPCAAPRSRACRSARARPISRHSSAASRRSTIFRQPSAISWNPRAR